ncbi:hypothetical protein A8C32_03980 [Flavivirga aquatica]|uniref:Uncharacterized protein n=1 Tax=Flavivirga aquatica TaxID=1849968 RepID=A0A1E5TBB2_9FLAO|nr:type VI secretion system tube protein TssD [Flavivirga aquatica]OEK08617.1 hypothetical protein A8C32_03980 [Flavivirga aquatica]
MRCEVIYLGLQVAPLKLSYKFERKCDKKGKPKTMVLGGGVKITLEANYETMRFLEEILSIDERYKNWDLENPTDSESYKKVFINIYDDEDYNIRSLELLDSYISNFKEVFHAVKENIKNEETNNVVNIEFKSATQIINNGATKNIFGWWLTQSDKDKTYKSPVNAVEEEKNPELVKGYWTSDKQGKKPLRKSNLGKTAYFHVETKDIKDGEKIKLSLAEYDYNHSTYIFFGPLLKDVIDPDDRKFPEEEVIKKATVKNNKATVELILQENWDSLIQDDKDNAVPLDHSIELYWEVSYKDELEKSLPESTNNYLDVFQSTRTLYFKTPTPTHNLPEFINYNGDPMLLMEFGKKFASKKIKDKALEIATKQAEKQIKKIAFAKLKKGYMVDNLGKVYKGRRLIYEYKRIYDNIGEAFENVQKGKDFGYKHVNKPHITTKGISQYDYFSKSGKRVTVLGMVKNLGHVFDIFNLTKAVGEDLDTTKPLPLDFGPLSPIADLAGVLVQQQKAEMDMWLEEDVQEEIDLAKLQGIEATRKAINTWNHNENLNWQLMAISNETANKLLRGDFDTFKKLENFENDLEFSDISKIEILYREMKNLNVDKKDYIIETIFIHE